MKTIEISIPNKPCRGDSVNRPKHLSKKPLIRKKIFCPINKILTYRQIPQYLCAHLRLPGLALTDHNNVYGAVGFQKAAQALDIQPILGAELTIEGPSAEAKPPLSPCGRGGRGVRGKTTALTRLAAEAAHLRLPGLALTDHNNVYGAVGFQKAAQALDIQPILGVELTIKDPSAEAKPPLSHKGRGGRGVRV